MSTNFLLNRLATTSDTTLLRICKKWIFSFVGQTVRDRDSSHKKKSVQNVLFINSIKFYDDRITTSSDTTFYQLKKNQHQYIFPKNIIKS